MEYDISFLGTTLNAELQKSLSLIQKSPLPLLKEFIQLAVDYLKGEDITDDFFTNFCSKFDGLEKSVGSVLLTGIYCIFRAALRKRVKADKFQLDLLEIKVPQPVINELSFAFYEKLEVLTKHATENVFHFPQLEKMRWRSDVTISSSGVSLSMKPSVFIELNLTDGTKQKFEVNALKFHQLRYYVAKVLKDMQDLENLAILKIE